MRRPRPPEQTSIIPGFLGGSAYSPRAAKLQRTVGTPDGVLTDLARGHGHTVMWWWGIRKIDGLTWAFCYVCNTPIVQGALNVGITDAQSAEIDNHRAGHWQDIQTGR